MKKSCSTTIQHNLVMLCKDKVHFKQRDECGSNIWVKFINYFFGILKRFAGKAYFSECGIVEELSVSANDLASKPIALIHCQLLALFLREMSCLTLNELCLKFVLGVDFTD